MSQENVEIARRWNAAFNRRDLQGLFELADPDVGWWSREDDPAAPVARGHDGLGEGIAEIDEAIAELRVEVDEFTDAGEYVIASVRVVGHGRGSGVSFEEHEVHVLRVRRGRVLELREYHDTDEASKALGLSE
jgi:ketosteroid isomerase-like protein